MVARVTSSSSTLQVLEARSRNIGGQQGYRKVSGMSFFSICPMGVLETAQSNNPHQRVLFGDLTIVSLFGPMEFDYFIFNADATFVVLIDMTAFKCDINSSCV